MWRVDEYRVMTIRKSDIPEYAICHVCGNPMQVVDVRELARQLGCVVGEGAFAIKCCNFHLTIDDNNQAKEIRDLLIAYHAQLPNASE